MALSREQLLAYLRLPKLGTVKGFALGNLAKENDIVPCTARDMIELLDLCRSMNPTLRISEYTTKEMQDALDIACHLIEMSEDKGIRLLTYYDDNFPEKLRQIRSNGKFAAPLTLWYRGCLDAVDLPGIAIIGTREPTPEGIKAGHYFGKAFAEAGFNVVSGLAYGCDKSGHEGALMAENGTTTAFLAHGLDTVYPKEHCDLADEIVARGGLLMSEYPIGTRGMANYFIERDRLQSGLSEACLVIQTGRTGGTLHAVRATIENGKPLYAVSYSCSDIMAQPKVAGNSMLINEGIEAGKGLAYGKATPLTSKNIEEVITSLRSAYDRSRKSEAANDATDEAAFGKDEKGQLLLFE